MRRPIRTAGVPSGIANNHHEGPAIDIPRTLFSAAVVLAMVLLSSVASRAIYTAMLRPSSDRSLTPLYGEGLILPPEPRLEGIEMMSKASAGTVANANDEPLQKFGWVDREKRIIRIPIQRAMELTLERDRLRSSARSSNAEHERADNSKTSDAKSTAQ